MRTIKIMTSFVLILSFVSCQDTLIQPTSTCVNDASIVINESHPKALKLQTIIDKYISKGVPGVTVLINDDNGFWINSGGFADIENGIEMQPCHINKLGSVTKMMIGAVVWQLIQEGKLNIHDKMSQYLPEVANRITNGNEITLAMLLNHSSGVYDVAGDLGYNLAILNDMTKSWTEAEILEYLEGKTPTNQPGEAVNYSNSNTLLVAMILEDITGIQHGELLKRYIFEPLGMDNTVYYDYAETFPITHLAQGYLDFYNDGRSIQNISKFNPGSGNGYTGVYSTVIDMYRFMNALLREKTLITPENLDLIFESMQIHSEGDFRTSTASILDEELVLFGDSPTIHAYGHNGGDIAYSANLNYFSHNNTIFAMTCNYGVALSSEVGEEVRNMREELYLVMVN